MELEKFGIKGKLVSAKRKAFKLFGLIASLGNEDSDASSHNPVFKDAPLEQTEALTYWHELRKAEALLNWKMWLDRPK